MSVPGPGWDDPILRLLALFVWLISHQPTVLFSQNKPATNNQPAVLFSQNKSAPAISHQPNERKPKVTDSKKPYSVGSSTAAASTTH
jgi:hypothetical protein